MERINGTKIWGAVKTALPKSDPRLPRKLTLLLEKILQQYGERIDDMSLAELTAVIQAGKVLDREFGSETTVSLPEIKL